jgi:NADH-ubiquinone oxidoreductase chain 5
MFIYKHIVWLVVITPLLGSILGGLAGFLLGRWGSVVVTVSSMGLTLLLVISFALHTVFFGHVKNEELFPMPWVDSELFYMPWVGMADSITIVMLVVVCTVSFLVHVYSSEYMSTDPHLSRFMSYLSLFTFFMLVLVTASNFFQMFIGWEGVGLCSYLLINFWFTRLQANKAALKAVIVNRVGDFSLAIAMFLIFYFFKSLNYEDIFPGVHYFKEVKIHFFFLEVYILDLLCFFIFMAAVGKSAQIGLHTWLPDAMEGPTPVSALIHAATMVTAGVFLIIRCSPIFEYAPNTLMLATILGALTAFFASTIGLVQNDMKRIIAYSTCSQLGYMVFACGVSVYHIALFHLSNHAFFKALLFISAGSVIHAMMDEQDMRKMGGLVNILPFTYTMVVIGSLALMGFPFLSGFYSKDAILESAYGSYSVPGQFAFWLGTFAASCTAFYSMRLLFLTFIVETNAYRKTIEKAHDAPIRMVIPMAILCFCTIFVGYLTRDLFIGLGTDFWKASIFILPENAIMVDSEFIPSNIKTLPLVFSLSGSFFAIVLYSFYKKFLFFYEVDSLIIFFYTFFNKKWFFDKFYNELINEKVLNSGYKTTYKLLDRGIIEKIGPTGLEFNIEKVSSKISSLNQGYVYYHIFGVFLGTLILLFLVFIYPHIITLGTNFYYLALIAYFIVIAVNQFDNK